MTVERGSRWYCFGHHWEVLEEAEKDGEPAVRVRCLTGAKPKKPWGLISLKALEKHGKLSHHQNGNHERAAGAAPKGGTVTDTATEKKAPAKAEAKQDEAPKSKEELLEIMASNQSGYDKYCKLRTEMKGAPKAKADELAKKQERHKPAFKAWKKAYNGLLKQGISLRQIKADQRAAAEAAAPAEEPAAAEG